MKSAVSNGDPHSLTNVTVDGIITGTGNSIVTAKTQVPTRTVTGAANLATIVLFGQSLATNTVYGGAYTPTNGTHIFNMSLADGSFYYAADPLLGCDQTRAHYGMRVADTLITDGVYSNVLLVPAAMGGTLVTSWGSGDCNHRIRAALTRLSSNGISPTFVIWSQGGHDTFDGTSQATYEAQLQKVIATIRLYAATCPIFITKQSWLSAVTSSAIIAAQTSVLNSSLGIYAGQNTDLLDGTYRTTDGNHFDQSGGIAQAAAEVLVIKNYLGI